MNQTMTIDAQRRISMRCKTTVSDKTAERVRTIVMIICALGAWTGACLDSTVTMSVSALAAMPALMLQLRALDRKGGRK